MFAIVLRGVEDFWRAKPLNFLNVLCQYLFKRFFTLIENILIYRRRF